MIRRIWMITIALACICISVLGISGCSSIPEMSTYQVMKVLEKTHAEAARAKASTGSWPSRVQELAPLAEYITDGKNVVRIGGAYFLVEYVPRVDHVGPWELIALTRSGANGAVPRLTREVYAIRTDGLLMVQSACNTLWVEEFVMILGLAAMIGLPIGVYLRSKASRRRQAE